MRGPLDAGGGDVKVDAPVSAALRLASVSPDEFRGLHHFDPWWVLRGMGEVADAHRTAVPPTNIARPFRFDGVEWKVHDVEFDAVLGYALRIEAKDAMYRGRSLTRETLDLDAAFGKRPAA